MYKVKDFENWESVVFQNKTVTKKDFRYMKKDTEAKDFLNTEIDSWEETENKTVILFVKN